MYLLYKSMALFWTLAEGLILIFIRWGFLFIKKGEGRQRDFLIFFATTFALLISLLFWGETILGRIVDLQKGIHLAAYRWALWNLFCTLWVILEGGIMIYGFRIYKRFKLTFQDQDLAKNNPRTNVAYGMPLLIASLFALYIFYECNLLSTIARYGLDARSLYRISIFYIRICGLFWILFEWIIAVLVIKIYVALKEMGEA